MPHSAKTRVLIVDDSPVDRKVVKAKLAKLGLKDVQEAENGTIAENKLRTGAEIGQPFDLVIADWHMPGGSGLNLLRHLRADAKTKKTRVIMMTATAERETVQEAIASGVDAFIVKPVEIEILIEKLASLGFQVTPKDE